MSAIGDKADIARTLCPLILRLPASCPLQKSVGEPVAEHRQPADGLGLGRLVLKHVPMLSEFAILDADDVSGDQAARRPLPENRPCAIT